MERFWAVVDAINNTLLSVPMLLALLGIGLLFSIWTKFSQYRSLTHGVALVAGKGIDTSHGDGALTHFQALTAAMSGTVGLGAIAGMAIAVDFGGPGAMFWMWVVGLVGMALKTSEVTLSLLYRDVSEPGNPHGGAMYVARDGLGSLPGLKGLGRVIGGVFCVALLLFAFTGGNMFQTWSVADTTREYFGVPTWLTGVILATLAAIVILGGIKRIGNVTKTLVPFKCGVYVLAGLYVILHNANELPTLFRLIFEGAFSKTDGVGAFAGGTLGSAFLWGMKRALFSSEAGLGTAPIAHSAVKTPEPVTEGVVAGLEPFIDTIFVCTVTGLVVLSTGVWNRAPVATWVDPPAIIEAAPGQWQPDLAVAPAQSGDLADGWKAGAPLFAIVEADGKRQRLYGSISDDGQHIAWMPIAAATAPTMLEAGLFADYRGSTLVAKGFDRVQPGLGRWLITIAVWVFGLSCIISYGYYGEQGVIYLFGARSITPYRVLWCVAAAVACFGFIKTSGQLDAISTVGLGFMYLINLPLLLILGKRAMAAYHDYFHRLDRGQIRRPGAAVSKSSLP